MNDFLLEFEEELSEMTLGTLDLSTGTWTETHKTYGYMEDMSVASVWIIGRSQMKISHRLFIPLLDNVGESISLEGNVYVVNKANFDWDTDTEEQLYKVQSYQPYRNHLYALLESIEF